MENKLDYKFFFDENVIFFADEKFNGNIDTPKLAEKILDSIYLAFDARDSTYAIKGIEQLFDLFRADKSISQLYVKYHCAEILKAAYKRLAKKSADGFKADLDRIFSENNSAKLKSIMIEYIKNLGKDNQDIIDESGRKVISKAVNIIREEYSNENLGLNYIADKVYLSPTYLSYLFKKETGQSLMKYIMQVRLEKARELLQDTNMKIADICKNVGYTKLSYFCMIFKNNFGVTPAKYRERRDIQ